MTSNLFCFLLGGHFQLVECLAIVTFVGATKTEETERSMQIMWQLLHPKLGSNVCICFYSLLSCISDINDVIIYPLIT